jgi:MFS family permease
VFLIRRHEPEPVHPDVAAGGKRPGMRQDIAQGLRYVAGHRYLRWIALSTAVSNLFSNILFAIFLVYLVRELGLAAGVIGVIFAIGNLGFLAGAILATRLERWIGLGAAIILGAVISSFGLLLVPLATAQTAFALLVASGLLVGFGVVVYNVNQVSFRQAITPERMQGRMNATMRFIIWGTIPIGSLVGGALGTTIGLLPTIWIGALGGLCSLLPLVLTPVRTLRTLPASPEEYAASEAARTAGGIGPVISTEAAVEIEERAEIVERAEVQDAEREEHEES